MDANTRMTRREFLRGLTLLAAAGAVSAVGLSGCKVKKSTPENYYNDKHDDFVKENRKMLTYLRPLLAEKYGETEANAIFEATFSRFDKLLPNLPYIGGDDNDLTMNLVNSAAALAFYQEMKARGGTVDDTGRMLFQTVKAAFSGDMMSGVMGRLSNSALAQDKIKKDAETSHKRAYAEDWVFDFVPGNEQFDFGINYTECGICKYFKAQGAEELTPYMCLLDAPISQAMNTGLMRTQTLGHGNPICDFRYKTGHAVEIEWDPGFVNGGKK